MHSLFGNQNIDKIVAVAILVVLLAISYLLFTNLYLSGLNELKSEIEINRKKAEKVDSILANEKLYQKKINEIKKKSSQAKNFLKSNQASTASSEIQNLIKGIISRNTKAKILTLKPYPAIQHEGYSEVSIEIRMREIGHEEIKNMLYKIESEQPLIIIKELEIGRAQQQYKSILGKTRSNENDLSITLVASAFYRDESNQ
jgi:hypothetical protein